MTEKLLICVLLLPLVAALAIICLWDLRRQKELRIVTCGTLTVMAVLLWYLAITGRGTETLTLFSLTEDFAVTFAAELFGRYFAAVAVTAWAGVEVFLSVCLEPGKHEPRFFICTLLISCTVTGLSYAANFMTMFLFFEATIFLFFPLIMHYQTEASAEAGRRYFLGAFLSGLVALMGACCFSMYVSDLGFVSGGALDATFAGGKNRIVILISAALMVAGFGMFSHVVSECGWLPGVERDIPVTVQAQSAGVIANLGVFAAVRSVYYLVGADYLFGSGAQVFLILFAVLMSGAGIFLMWRTGNREDIRLGRIEPEKRQKMTSDGETGIISDGEPGKETKKKRKMTSDRKAGMVSDGETVKKQESTSDGKTEKKSEAKQSGRMLYIVLNQSGYAFLLLAIFQPVGLYLALGYAAVHMLMAILIPLYTLMKD
ncbi:MAG: hypothetical protein LUE29_00145 [Lachnospiraceae bacterium]|nr:hypothetical protein [Lachnospiraceae bacterium]